MKETHFAHTPHRLPDLVEAIMQSTPISHDDNVKVTEAFHNFRDSVRAINKEVKKFQVCFLPVLPFSLGPRPYFYAQKVEGCSIFGVPLNLLCVEFRPGYEATFHSDLLSRIPRHLKKPNSNRVEVFDILISSTQVCRGFNLEDF